MLQPFIIVLREGFEAFLIVAVILAYLRKTGQQWLSVAVYWAVATSIVVSAALGYLLNTGIDQSFWEGVLGVVAIIMVASLVIHMWRTAPQLKKRMERRLEQASSTGSRLRAFLGVFLFTVLMISREGMETALMLIQVHTSQWVLGALLGLVAAVALAWIWVRMSHLINMKRFFQVTGIFLLLFMVQVAIYSFHEFSESGLFPNSDAIHEATEAFSPDGIYGRWFSIIMIAACALWLIGAWIADRLKAGRQNNVELRQGQA
ncbi:MAG TPA: FTR1 family protein [Pyrinomonadaceae bacterium]|jgi:high-affinity iron transporter